MERKTSETCDAKTREKVKAKEEEEESRDFLLELPTELFLPITAQLNCHDLVAAAAVCRAWYGLFTADLIWEPLWWHLLSSENETWEAVKERQQPPEEWPPCLGPYHKKFCAPAPAFEEVVAFYIFTREQFRPPLVFSESAWKEKTNKKTSSILSSVLQMATKRSKERSSTGKRLQILPPPSPYRKFVMWKLSEVQEGRKPLFIKIVAMGNLGVGKTSLIAKFCRGDSLDVTSETLPIKFQNYTARVFHEGREVALSLWDTEMWDTRQFLEGCRRYFIHNAIARGGEDYTTMRLLTYPNTDVFLFCFALDDMESFEYVERKWVPEVQLYARHTPQVRILCGTKADLMKSRQVPRLKAVEAARRMGACAYVERSSATGDNVDLVFEACFHAVKDHLLDSPTERSEKTKEVQHMTLKQPDEFYGFGGLISTPNANKKQNYPGKISTNRVLTARSMFESNNMQVICDKDLYCFTLDE